MFCKVVVINWKYKYPYRTHTFNYNKIVLLNEAYHIILCVFVFCSHRSVAVKRSMSCFISVSLERFGAGKFLHCSKDVLDKVLPALVQLTTDPSPEARYSLS